MILQGFLRLSDKTAGTDTASTLLQNVEKEPPPSIRSIDHTKLTKQRKTAANADVSACTASKVTQAPPPPPPTPRPSTHRKLLNSSEPSRGDDQHLCNNYDLLRSWPYHCGTYPSRTSNCECFAMQDSVAVAPSMLGVGLEIFQ